MEEDGDVGEEHVEALEHDRARKRPQRRSRAAEEGHDDRLDREVHVEHGRRVDKREPIGVDAPRDPEEEGAGRVGQDLVRQRSDAEDLGGVLVLPDRRDRVARPRAGEDVSRGHGQGQRREGPVVERREIPGDREVHPGPAAGDLEVGRELLEDDHEPEAGDREVMPAQAEEHRSHRGRGGDRQESPGRERRGEREVGVEHQDPRRIRADADEGGRAEVRISGVPADEVPPRGEQPEHEDPGDDPDIVGAGEGRDGQRGGERGRGEDRAGGAGTVRPLTPHPRNRRARPNSPAGRTSRTRMSTLKATMLSKFGPSHQAA